MEANAQNKIVRNELLDAQFEERTVSKVKVVEIEFPAGQKAPLHKHPCPVIGSIVEGECLVQVEGEPAKVLKAGDAFYEPADTPIIHFDNYSEKEPMKFIAYYLLKDEKDLIELLPKR
ncbi:MAG: cupin domain-containing protein [Bacteroidales bacterium]|nr:cupin domain-containing protein [Bacteroidales bacterium]